MMNDATELQDLITKFQDIMSEATSQSITLLQVPLEKAIVNTSLTITILAGATIGFLVANLIKKIFPGNYYFVHITSMVAGSFCGLVTGVALVNILGYGNLIVA